MRSRWVLIGAVLAAVVGLGAAVTVQWGGWSPGPGGGMVASRAPIEPPALAEASLTPVDEPRLPPAAEPSPAAAAAGTLDGAPLELPALEPGPAAAADPASGAPADDEPTAAVASAGVEAPPAPAAPPAIPSPAAAAPQLPPPGPTPELAAAPAAHWDRAYAAAVLAGVNARRTGAGLPPLAAEPRLTAAAEGYARQMLENQWYEHTGPDGRTFVQRIVDAGFPFTVPVGEVLAWSSAYVSPETIVEAWMNSPSHRQQILSPLYGLAGVGCYVAAGGALWCAADLAGR